MKICAIICEFNPLHNGHKYIIEQAKKLSGCDAVMCVMSGNFVQRAEPAVINKSRRTEAALICGADIVIELPAMYAVSNASVFAQGAINLISRFDNVTHLAFGCEDNSIEHLNALAEISAAESDAFKAELHSCLSIGLSYAKSRSVALSRIAENLGFDGTMSDIILSKPNNLLAIEYIKSLKLIKSAVSPLPVRRIGSGYNDLTLTGKLSSASAIRKLIFDNPSRIDIESLRQNVPTAMLDSISECLPRHLPDYKIFGALTINSLRNSDLSELPDSGEGLEIKLKKAALRYSDLVTAISKVKSKRYTLAKIRRLCLQSLLTISKDALSSPFPVRILGIKSTYTPYLKHLPPDSILQNSDITKLDRTYGGYIKIEQTAASVYSLITSTDNDSFYSYKLIKI